MKKLATIILTVFFLAACAPISQEAKQDLAKPINCATCAGDIRVLRGEKASVAKEIASGATAIYPAAAVMGILTGTEKAKFQVATGDYNKMIDDKIAQIQSACPECSGD